MYCAYEHEQHEHDRQAGNRELLLPHVVAHQRTSNEASQSP